MKLYFVRHGESEANILHVISNRGWKHGLTEKGSEQSRQLAQKLATAGISKIYTSPLRRAVETAQILALALGAPIEVTQALAEYDCGSLEGKSDEQSWLLHRELHQAWTLHQKWDQRIEGGESFLDIQRRFMPFIEQLTTDGYSSQAKVVLVGHGGTFICMLPLALKNVTSEFAEQHGFPNTAFVLAETTPQGVMSREWCGVKTPEVR